jgi:hypothetical protein
MNVLRFWEIGQYGKECRTGVAPPSRHLGVMVPLKQVDAGTTYVRQFKCKGVQPRLATEIARPTLQKVMILKYD